VLQLLTCANVVKKINRSTALFELQSAVEMKHASHGTSCLNERLAGEIWEGRVFVLRGDITEQFVMFLGRVQASWCILWIDARSSVNIWAGCHSSCQHLLHSTSSKIQDCGKRRGGNGDGGNIEAGRCCINTCVLLMYCYSRQQGLHVVQNSVIPLSSALSHFPAFVQGRETVF